MAFRQGEQSARGPLASSPLNLILSALSPTTAVWLLAAVQVLLWGGMSSMLSTAQSDDSLEQVLLSQELRLEYGKHPPLPTWILYATNRLFGASIGSTYVLGALCAAASVLLLYAFARPLVGASRAALAAILLSNIEYLNAGTAYFNHNTVQLPLALLTILLFHRALTRMRMIDWALLGFGGGLMMLAKFSAVVLFAAFAAYLVWSRPRNTGRLLCGLAIAMLIGAAMIAPHLIAVRGDQWSPDAYAKSAIFPDVSRIECLKTIWSFSSSQFAKVLPALLVFTLVWRSAPRAAPEPAGRPVPLAAFLTIVGFGPMVLTVVIATLTGAYLLVGWGTTFHVLLTFWLVAFPRLAIDASPALLRRAWLATLVVQLILWALVITHGGRLPNLNRTRHETSPAAPAALADIARASWAAHCAAPLRYVVTDGHTGPPLAVRFDSQPRIVNAMRPEFVKFFSVDARLADGAIVIIRRPAATPSPDPAPHNPLTELMADATWRSTTQLVAADGSWQTYELGIVAPETGEGCEYDTSR